VTRPTHPFLLVPGAGGSAWYWHSVVAELEARGHEAIAVDLPGDDESADLPDYVDNVVAAAGARRDLVLAGQSLGGFSATLACFRLPVSHLILVNAMIPRPGETAGEWWEATGQRAARVELDKSEGRDPDADFDPLTYFLHDVDPALLDGVVRNNREQAKRPFGTPADFEHWPPVPTHVIVGRDDRFFPAGFQRQVARDRLGIDADVLPGGHLIALARPIELVDQMTAYLAD
jgi:pimeloyl-ACP methyl ester carboxylesterase